MKMIGKWIGIVLWLPLMTCGAQQLSQSKTEIEKRVNDLISRMSLEEKIGQMHQITASDNLEEMKNLIRAGRVGSILNETNGARVNELQKVAMKESKAGIPVLISRDVIHGFKTIFPIPLGQAASFNPDVAEEGARVAAIEASSVGIRWTFAPMIDVSRDPRWGRIAESCGEDPYLTSVMGAAMVKGFQGKAMSDPTSMAACAKHFVAYGAVEGGRDYNSTFLSERQLRNVYFPPFEAAVQAGVATFMTSFNDNDGIPASGNAFLLRDVLRKEWGFDGLVVSDWGAVTEMISHGFCLDKKEAALKAALAGVDMDMVSGAYLDSLGEMVREGSVPEAVIDEAVKNILRVKMRLGLFEQPYTESGQKSVMYADSHLKAAKKAALESAILLKNEGTLPLAKSIRSLAVIGPMADAPHDQMGTWVFDGEKSHTVTPLAALREAVENRVELIYEPGLKYSRDTSKEGIDRAVLAASKADVILAFIGEEAILTGEAHCLAGLHLQGAQSELIASLKATGKPLVTIVMAGRPLTIEKEIGLSDAVLYSFHPGTMGGPALADLLLGKVSPSGKTPVTFPREVGQIPCYYAHNQTGRPAGGWEKLLKDLPLEAGQTSQGCSSYYMDAGFTPLYPFGYGLSYTTFEYNNVRLSSTELKENDVLIVTFDLKNTGTCDATEIPQLYIRDQVASITRPVKELKRFCRVALKSGEKKTISFELPVSELAFWNVNKQKVVEPGEFTLWVGTDSQSGAPQKFTVISSAKK